MYWVIHSTGYNQSTSNLFFYLSYNNIIFIWNHTLWSESNIVASQFYIFAFGQFWQKNKYTSPILFLFSCD